MKITWALGTIFGNWQSGFQTTLASDRYRGIIPAMELRRLGHECDLIDFRKWTQVVDKRVAAGGCLVVGKFVRHNSVTSDEQTLAEAHALLANMQRCSDSGVRVAADFCDDRFDHPLFGEIWRELARRSSVCVAGTPELAERVRAHTNAPVVVIGDPIASPHGTARVFRRGGWAERWLRSKLASSQPQRLKLVWYGHTSNWLPMQEWIARLAPLAREQPWLLNIVTTLREDIEQFAIDFNTRFAPEARIQLHAWSERVQWEVVGDSHVALLPSNLDDARKTVKTGNRLTDALNAGCHVVATPIPAYTQFSAFVDLTDNPVQALREYLRDPNSALARVQHGQAAVAEAAAPALVAAQWLEALGTASGAVAAGHPSPSDTATPPATSAPAAAATRLNLGCGDKILPGYINVDVVEARAGKSPDVICDLHHLTPFPDDHADEVLAVHVVEHFWRWEVEDVLREWVRVLRPGGRMVLECPNLRSACEAFLADTETGSHADARGQRTMWVFYGDPQWKDPLMVHRWGYTPESLAALMRSVGLVNARQEPAQYKLREPRDMRIVAEKPSA